MDERIEPLCKLRRARADPTAACAPVLLIGDTRLATPCRVVVDVHDEHFQRQVSELHATLEQFRRENGFGRAISAPQIGLQARLIALNLNKDLGPFTLVNPVITHRSSEMLTMWDDCFSVPWLMVRVARHRSISVSFVDEDGQSHDWHELPPDVSELLQHEIDHLDGVLLTSRAIDVRTDLVARSVYLAERARFDSQVDYTIAPTV